MRFLGKSFRLFQLGAAAIVLLLLFVSPAIAPQGDKRDPGGRTLASIQEEEFDDRLFRLETCYGVRFAVGDIARDRRRACKAILLHEIETALAAPGAVFRTPVLFRCEDTASKPSVSKDSADRPVFALRPNDDYAQIDRVLTQYLRTAEVTTEEDKEQRRVCQAAIHCQKLLRFRTFGLGRIRACVSGEGSLRQKLVLTALSQVLFPGQQNLAPVVNRMLDGRF